MARTVGIGNQNFADIITNNYFYIDKTMFIQEWWENGDAVTLITRPRRFGKTLLINMVERFFSTEYERQGSVFEGLSIWQEEKYRRLQGTCPVISLSFANIKAPSFQNAKKMICRIIKKLYNKFDFLLAADCLKEDEKEQYREVSATMEDYIAWDSLNALSEYLYRYYHKKVIILLDEYDTPMQEAYVNGYWNEMAGFIRSLLNSTFKTNPYLDRAIMTGITRISRESIFSDLNNLFVVTSTSDAYADSFGFTQREVTAALAEYGLSEKEQSVKEWYDGFTFGKLNGIYNPWSILNYLRTREFAAYWANTSSNSLVGELVREGSPEIKIRMEDLLKGESFHASIDEQLVYDQLDGNESAVWSLLLVSGYLKVICYEAKMTQFGKWIQDYELAITNFEVQVMFQSMIHGWFGASNMGCNDFIKALLRGDTEEMNVYMNRMAEEVFSSFDTGKKPSRRSEPERFYHGFVLGLLVELNGQYVITSNRESGFGRYDVQLEPQNSEDDAILIEFKVRNPQKEQTLEDTLRNALEQIETKGYAAGLRQRGIEERRIRRYGIVFEGKRVLIG